MCLPETNIQQAVHVFNALLCVPDRAKESIQVFLMHTIKFSHDLTVDVALNLTMVVMRTETDISMQSFWRWEKWVHINTSVATGIRGMPVGYLNKVVLNKR